MNYEQHARHYARIFFWRAWLDRVSHYRAEREAIAQFASDLIRNEDKAVASAQMSSIPRPLNPGRWMKMFVEQTMYESAHAETLGPVPEGKRSAAAVAARDRPYEPM